MALTSNNLELIKAVAVGNMNDARRYAQLSLSEDKTKKNEWIVNRYTGLLTGNASIVMSNMPTDLQTFLVGETPDEFDPQRYVLREEEREVFESIRRMKLIADKLAEKRISYKNTSIIYGESGTGKTQFGRYVAHKLNLPFFYISFSNAIDSYMGNTAKNIRKVFDFCSAIPCVLMLDEIDCVAMNRVAGGSKGVDGELERTTITVMQEFDRLPNHVVLIAATNRPGLVDTALMRRFSIQHKMTSMSKEELLETATCFLSATGTSQYVCAEELSLLTEKYSTPGAMMPELIRLVGDSIYKENKDALEKEDTEKDGDKIDLWRVIYTWETNISAETENDAIAIARNMRGRYTSSPKTCTEKYEAQRADYIYPNQEQK